MSFVTYLVSFHGRVQGVGMRMCVLREAQLRGINGWVRNAMREDLVEACLQGEKKVLDDFLAFLKSHSCLIRVDHVVVNEIENGEVFKGFCIRY